MSRTLLGIPTTNDVAHASHVKLCRTGTLSLGVGSKLACAKSAAWTPGLWLSVPLWSMQVFVVHGRVSLVTTVGMVRAFTAMKLYPQAYIEWISNAEWPAEVVSASNHGDGCR